VQIEVSATAACINPGGRDPSAANKESLSAQGTFPVQNGKADFSLTLTATFQPECSPPMTVQFTDVVVCDLTHKVVRGHLLAVGRCPREPTVPMGSPFFSPDVSRM